MRQEEIWREELLEAFSIVSKTANTKVLFEFAKPGQDESNKSPFDNKQKMLPVSPQPAINAE